MFRRLSIAAPVISLLLCVAVVAIWTRPLKVSDMLTYGTASGTSYSFGTGPGCLDIDVIRNLPPVAPEFQHDAYPAASRGWSSSSFRWGAQSRSFVVASPQPQPTSSGAVISGQAFSFVRIWIPRAHAFLGIGWESRDCALGPPIWTRAANVQSTQLVVRLWIILLGTALLPIVRLSRRLRAHRHRPGHCLTCGYDLRASNDLCPECGTPIPSKAEATA